MAVIQPIEKTRDGISVVCSRYPIFLLQLISYVRYIGSISPNQYPISDILAQPISEILTDTDIRYLHKSRYIGFSDISVIRYAIPRKNPIGGQGASLILLTAPWRCIYTVIVCAFALLNSARDQYWLFIS